MEKKLRNQSARACDEIATVPRIRRFPKTLNGEPLPSGITGSRLVDRLPHVTHARETRSFRTGWSSEKRERRLLVGVSRLNREKFGRGRTVGCTCVSVYCSAPRDRLRRPTSLVRAIRRVYSFTPDELRRSRGVVFRN